MSDHSKGRDNKVEIPLFRTEEGRYLATSLGDPLIKGLTEVANSRPTDPVAFLANYLHGFSKHKDTVLQSSINAASSAAPAASELGMQPTYTAIVPQAETESTRTDAVQASSSTVPTTEPDMSPTDDTPELAQSSDDRDEHGQSLLHFACARAHERNALGQLIDESGVSIAYRDELYRTARDVSYQASQPANASEIDRYVLSQAAQGNLEFFEHLLLEGYDHIGDVEDENGAGIAQIVSQRNQTGVVRFLATLEDFEEARERLHRAIRQTNVGEVRELLASADGARLARAKNYYGRTAMHLAVLCENEDIVDMISTQFPRTLRLGDNLDRTPLHFAMGVSNVEALSRILIKNGAKRVLKDLKGRQPSYYFMNKADISRLKEEEEEDHEGERDRQN